MPCTSTSHLIDVTESLMTEQLSGHDRFLEKIQHKKWERRRGLLKTFLALARTVEHHDGIVFISATAFGSGVEP